MKVIVTFSGGKDSLASLLWVRNNLTKDFITIFCDTGWEHPLTYKYIEEIREQLGLNLITVKSKKFDGMADLAKKKSRWPSSQRRFCTSELKTIPMIDYILDEVNDDILIIQGIRASESAKRAEMSKQCTYFKYYVQPYGKDKHGKDKFHTYRRKDVLAFREKHADDLLRPVFDWSAQQVIDYILENGVQPNPLYRMGYKRVGCYPCVMASQQDIYNISVQDTERINYIAKLEQRLNSSFFSPDKISSKYYQGDYPLIREDEDVGEKYYLSDMKIEWLEKHSAKTGNAFHKFTGTDKACCITSTAEVKNNLSTNYVCVAMRGRNPDNPSNRTSGIHTEQRIEPNMDGKTNCLTSVQKDNLILQRPRGNNQGGEFTEKAPTLTSNHWEQNNLLMKRINQLNISDESNGRQPYQQNRVFDIDGISPALMNGHAGQTINVLIKNKRIKDNLRRTDDKSLTLRATSYKGAESNGMTLVKNGEYRIRRLTPTECARLQTIPDWYKWQCSETQQYKMLGNGWTVAVVSHILQYLKFKTLQS